MVAFNLGAIAAALDHTGRGMRVSPWPRWVAQSGPSSYWITWNHDEDKLLGRPGEHCGCTGPCTSATATPLPQFTRTRSAACCPHQLPQPSEAAARWPG